MDLLHVWGVSKKIGGALVVNDVSLAQQKRQRIAIAGETGSGKSTLLRIIGGFVQPDSGEVFFEKIRVRGPEEKLIPGHPGIAYLSQQFELANNYRVDEVLQYANKLPEEDAVSIYEVCRIDHLLKRRTDQVSGGEKQRIAVARLLISSPGLLLLDEPYSNLDMIHKNILRSVIDDIGNKLGISCILVSHDPADTLSWADEIIVMKEGQIIQKGSPETIYWYPQDKYVAGLFGKYNLANIAGTETFNNLPENKKDSKTLFTRPEDVKIVVKGTEAAKGLVSKVVFLGSSYEIEIQLAGKMIIVKTGESNLVKGDTVYVALNINRGWYI